MDSGKSPTKNSPLQDLLWTAHGESGSWDAVAERVAGTTGEALRRIAEGITRRPQRSTVDAITLGLKAPVAPAGASREAAAILSLLREAVTRQERLVQALGSVPDDEAAATEAEPTANLDAPLVSRRDGARGAVKAKEPKRRQVGGR